jgi:hypothetical protein
MGPTFPQPAKTTRRRPALGAAASAIALLLVFADPLRGTRLQPTRPDAQGFPVLAGEVHQLVASNDAIAVVSTSSMGERTVSVRRLPTGEELLKRTDAAAFRIALRDGRLAFFDRSSRVIVVDVASGRERLAWSPGEDARAAAVCLGASRLFVLTQRSNGSDQLISMALGGAPGADAEPRTAPVPARPNPTLQCSDTAAVVSSPGGDDALLWTDGLTTVIPLDGHELLGLSDRYLYGSAAASAVARRPTSGGTGWQTIYQGTGGRVRGLALVDAEEAVVLVELTTAGSADVVVVPANGKNAVRKPLPGERDWERPELWTVAAGSIAALGRRDATAWVFLTSVPSREEATPVMPRAPEDAAGANDARAGAKALAWMERQLGPRFQTRQKTTGRLIDSYEDKKRVGWTYDAAVAAIAFAARGRTDLSRELLAGLAHLQNEDGSWEFAYDPDRALPINGERFLGTMAWVVMAANFFEWETGDHAFDPMAQEGLRFINRFVVRDPASSLDGGVSMGPVAPQTYSTEHNVDAYSAFYWRGRLAGRADYLETAARLQAFITRELVSGGDTAAAYFKVGSREATLYLDPQTWTTLALVSPTDSAGPSLSGLDLADRRLRVTNGRLGEVADIVGFRDAETAALTKVWSEGTEGMVAARLWLGQVDAARGYHQETSRMQTSSGGIPYASENREDWPSVPSAAGTAWYVLNHDWPPRNPFVPDNKTWLESHARLEKDFPLNRLRAR